MNSKVYIPNNSGHDFSDAKRFGELTFITEGMINRFNINSMYRIVVEALKDSSPDDYIMVGGLTHINVVLTSVFTFMHGRLNLLLYDVKDEEYVVRKIVVSNLIEEDEI